MKNTRLDLKKVFQSAADEIINTQKKSKIIHSTKNIHSSGLEVEIKIRDILSTRLPKKCNVAQGHIVDRWWATSTQLDIILFDNMTSTPLFVSEDDTSYIPYESTYGFGEIKSTYYRDSKPIENFIDVIKNVKTKFSRSNIGGLSEDVLFTFMFFVNSNDLNIEEIAELYLKTDNKYLPSAICFLDKGVIVRAARYKEINSLHGFNYAPEFENLFSLNGLVNSWQFMNSGSPSPDNWFNLLIIQYVMISFVNLIQIKPTDLINRLQWAMMESKSIVFKKDDEV